MLVQTYPVHATSHLSGYLGDAFPRLNRAKNIACAGDTFFDLDWLGKEELLNLVE